MHETVDSMCINLHGTCMKLVKRKQPKVQRGISLPKDLRDRIQEYADRVGATWNDVAEGALRVQFPCAPDTNKSGQDSIESGDQGLFDA